MLVTARRTGLRAGEIARVRREDLVRDVAGCSTGRWSTRTRDGRLVGGRELAPARRSPLEVTAYARRQRHDVGEAGPTQKQ